MESVSLKEISKCQKVKTSFLKKNVENKSYNYSRNTLFCECFK